MTAEFNVILNGDCLEVLRSLPDNYVDSVVTDPPYGLSKEPNISEVLTKWLAGEPYDHGHGGFMGKAWDSFVPHPDVWREVYRVLKPGGHALVFAGTRTQDIMTIALRLGGFEIRDVIEWLYFSGFPKSMDVGKAFDKRNGSDGIERVKLAEHIKQKRKESGITLKQLNELFGYVAGCNWWESTNYPNTNRVPNMADWARLKAIIGVSSEFDWLVERIEAGREKVGEKTSGIGQAFGDGVWVSESKVVDVTAPATELARKWDGWGTALKPAHEPVIVARKPLAGTVADTVEKHGTGALNIDGCRIGRGEGDRTEYGVDGDEGSPQVNTYGERQRVPYVPADAGRFPANCATTDDNAFYSPYFNVSPAEVSKKASKRDRNSDVNGEEIALEPKFTKTMGDGIGGRPHNEAQPTAYNRNSHPTVKPTDLMAWLIRLVTPPGGTVLDPFAGSGSTLVAAKREGFDFIGIEREAEYVEIAKARTDSA